MLKIIDFPLNFLRDYTIPPPGEDDWNRTRAAITPATIVFAFFWLNAQLFQGDDENNTHLIISVYCVIPGVVIGILVRFFTKVTKPPDWIMIIYSLLAFIMSIMWIKFTSDTIMDLL